MAARRRNNNNNTTTTSVVSAVSALLCLLLAFGAPTEAGGHACLARQFPHGLTCECNSTHCDHGLRFRWPDDPRRVVRVVSDAAGARFATDAVWLGVAANGTAEAPAEDYSLEVRINVHRQRVEGFGGAFSDSSAQLVWALDEATRCRLLDDYFGPAGLDFNMGRVPLGGTDMSTRPYSYDDAPAPDPQLSKFALQPEDLLAKIPLIERVNRGRGRRGLPPLKLIASSWSPPAWMKTNAHLVQGFLYPQHMDTYARYLVRAIDEYATGHNISFWALSPQNEPYSPERVGPAVIRHNSVTLRPEENARFLADHLAPKLDQWAANRSASRGSAAPKPLLFWWEDTIEGFDRYQAALKDSPTLADRLEGVAMHWYAQGLREIPHPYRRIHEARASIPYSQPLLSTEASFIGVPQPGNWTRAQRYALDMIETLRAGYVAWLDWNLVLDSQGGPTWCDNKLDAAILVDANTQSYIKNPMYYALGHLSRFVLPGSRVVHSELLELVSAKSANATPTHTNSSSNDGGGHLHALAAELPSDGPAAPSGRAGASDSDQSFMRRKLALVLLNNHNRTINVRLELVDCLARELGSSYSSSSSNDQQARSPAILELSPRSITSLAVSC